MSSHAKNGGRRGLYLAAATTAVLVAVGALLLIAGLPAQGPPQPPSPVTVAQSSDTTAADTAPGVTGSRVSAVTEPDLGPILPASRPVSLSIPSIGVRSNKIVDLAYTKDGGLEVPKDFNLPGWFSPGPSPGQFGPAVIAGHVDSKAGPAVFFWLGALKPGALVSVGRADGSTATFKVDRVERYPKDAFPTEKVYGNSGGGAELRLITCGGKFDRSIGRYVDNVVAYARLVG